MIHVNRSTGKSSPLVVSVPHAGQVYPDDILPLMESSDPLLLTRDGDLHVHELYEKVPQAGGSFIFTDICRYVIDLNRDPKVIDASFVTGAPIVKNPKFLGIVAHKTTKGEPLIKRPLTLTEYQQRLDLYYHPFHNTLKELIQEKKKEFGYCIHIDGHSMPSQGASGHKDAGAKRLHFDLGDRHGTSCHAKLTQFIQEHFTAFGHSVSNNSPYPGGFITEHYGNPQENCHSIQIEINRKIYMNEDDHTKQTNKFTELQSAITELVNKVGSLNFN